MKPLEIGAINNNVGIEHRRFLKLGTYIVAV